MGRCHVHLSWLHKDDNNKQKDCHHNTVRRFGSYHITKGESSHSEDLDLNQYKPIGPAQGGWECPVLANHIVMRSERSVLSTSKPHWRPKAKKPGVHHHPPCTASFPTHRRRSLILHIPWATHRTGSLILHITDMSAVSF